VRDVDEQLLLLEDLDLVPWRHLGEALARERRQGRAGDDDGAADPLAAHALGVGLDDFHALGERYFVFVAFGVSGAGGGFKGRERD